MLLPNGAMVAVADGEKLALFHNRGDEGHPELVPIPSGPVESGNHGSGARHHTSSANPDHGLVEEDSHAAGVAAMLNAEILGGRISSLVVIAAPRALGELRKHFSKQLQSAIIGEIAKDLTGHTAAEIEKTIAAG